MGVAVAAMMLVAAPALADVKAGTEAWARGDYKRALAEWRPAALAGDPDAQFNMGQAYKLGRGVPVDPAQAEEWFHKAALQNHLQASDNYGLALFQDGKKAEAAPWLDRSASRGEPRTQLVLGTMLFNGDGVPRDYPRAYALMTRAAQQGLKPAADTLAQMDQYISAPDRERGVQLAEQYQAQAQSAQVAAATPGSRAPRGAGGRSVVVDRGLAPSAPVQTADAPRSPAAARAGGGRSVDGPRTVDLPPSQADAMPDRRHVADAAATPRAAAAPAPRAAAMTERHQTADAAPRAAPAAPERRPATPSAPRPAPRGVASGGRWRVQLGAFRDKGNAQTLWSRIGARVGGSPVYATNGGITRLQAGPFASQADAQRACTHAAGTGCVVVPAS